MSSVLYDVPGPAARRRNAAIGMLGTLLILAGIAFVIYQFAVTGQFASRLWEWILYVNVQYLLLDALRNTVSAFAVAAVLSLAFGAVFAAGRLSDHRWVSRPSSFVVELFRAVPLLVMIFIIYFGLSRTFDLDVPTFWAVVVGLMLYNGSVLAEVFRAGVLALPRGQREAAYALGLRKTQVMTSVLLPQALRAMLPTILSQLVVVLKDTALGFIILYPELLYQARYLGSQPQFGLPILPVALVIAAIYITMCLLLSGLAKLVERRLSRTPKGGGPDALAAARARLPVATGAATGAAGGGVGVG